MVVGIIIAVLILLVLFCVGIYNNLVRLRNNRENAFANIDVQLKRRADLIPQLVSTVRGYDKKKKEKSAINTLRLIEDMDYDNLVLSIKSSNVAMNYKAHLLVKDKTNHPLHIGITESGSSNNGKIKSAIGIGGLLLAGIGDTIRVSLTDNPIEEVKFAKKILETVGIRKKQIEIVSCPT